VKQLAKDRAVMGQFIGDKQRLAAGSGGFLLPHSMLLWLTLNEYSMFFKSLATVLELTWMPIEFNSAAILPVVFRVHFNPLIGSPAVSYFINRSISLMTFGVFFQPAFDQRPFFEFV
jgi:hypothetical protein